MATAMGALIFITASGRWLKGIALHHSLLPFNDSWKIPPIGIHEAMDQPFGPQTIAILYASSSHNDSINFIPVLLEFIGSLPRGYWTPSTSIWLAAWSWVALLALTLVLCCRQLRSPLARVTLVALGCLIGFAPSFRFLIPFGIHRVLPLACAVLIAALLSRSKLRWLPVALSLALAITATFSFANGFLCFAVLWAALAWTTFLPADSRRPPATPARGPLLLATGLVTLTMGLLYGSQLDRHHLELFAERHRGDSLLTKVGQGFLSWFSAPYDLINDAFNLIFRPLGEGKWMLLGAFILLGLGMAGLFLLASRKGPAAQPLNRPGCFCGSLLIGYFIPTTLMLARYRSKGFGDDRYFCEVTLLSLLIGTVLFLINGRGRLKLPSRLPNMLRLDALVVFAVFTLLPLYYTPPYLMAMQDSLPAAVNRIESCLAAEATSSAGEGLWEHCSVEEIAADDRSRSTFERLRRESYLDTLKENVQRRSSAAGSDQPPELP